MAAPLPPGAPRHGYTPQQVPPPPPATNSIQNDDNMNSVADNTHNLNPSRPPPMPNYGPRPPLFGQPPPFLQSAPHAVPGGASQPISRLGPPPAALVRPLGHPSAAPPSTLPQNVTPVRSTGGQTIGQPLHMGSRPPPPFGTRPSPPVSSPALRAQSSSGSATNEPLGTAGPQLPDLRGASQPPPGPPPMMTSAQARAPPQMRSVSWNPASTAPVGPSLQPAPPFPGASQGILPPPTMAYGHQAWPAQPQQVNHKNI